MVQVKAASCAWEGEQTDPHMKGSDERPLGRSAKRSGLSPSLTRLNSAQVRSAYSFKESCRGNRKQIRSRAYHDQTKPVPTTSMRPSVHAHAIRQIWGRICHYLDIWLAFFLLLDEGNVVHEDCVSLAALLAAIAGALGVQVGFGVC